MSLLKIARMGHPVLRRNAEPVDDVNGQDLRRLIEDMIETLADSRGVGLAAPQVHQAIRVIVVTVPRDGDPTLLALARDRPMAGERLPVVLINPTVSPIEDGVEVGFEGCLSIPGLRGDVPRWKRVVVTALDGDGHPCRFEAADFEARILQHEVDHLNGILYPDRMSSLRNFAFESEMHHVLET